MKAIANLGSDFYTSRPKKINKYIEIVSSSDYGLSSMSNISRQAVYDVLRQHYSKVRISLVNSLADLESLVALQPDLVFLGMRYVPLDPNDRRGPNRVWLSAYLDEHNIAYTGSAQPAHQLESNKSLAKQRILDVGLKTPPFYVAQRNMPAVISPSLAFPLFVKPTDRGGGQGIDKNSVVCNSTELDIKIDSISKCLQADSLIEQYLPGREFSVAILKEENTDRYTAMPIELLAPRDSNGNRILSSAVKTADSERFMEIFDTGLKDKINKLAINAFMALGARDYGRIDIRLDHTATPQFLEANLLPSLVKGYGNFPKACASNKQLDYDAIILAIASHGLKREHFINYFKLLGINSQHHQTADLIGSVPIM